MFVQAVWDKLLQKYFMLSPFIENLLSIWFNWNSLHQAVFDILFFIIIAYFLYYKLFNEESFLEIGYTMRKPALSYEKQASRSYKYFILN